jgi:23S rRNA (uridine2552-2'-O)-methyltransferase
LEGKITRGFLIAVDPLPITRGGRCRVIEGYAGEPEVNEQINELLQGQQLDLVLSDMAPNISGVRAVDQARAMDLADIALQACEDWLANGGDLAIKAFQGEGLDAWVAQLKHQFGHVNMMKPKASRPESREVFVVARGFQGGAKTNT